MASNKTDLRKFFLHHLFMHVLILYLFSFLKLKPSDKVGPSGPLLTSLHFLRGGVEEMIE